MPTSVAPAVAKPPPPPPSPAQPITRTAASAAQPPSPAERTEKLQPLLAAGDWRGIAELLGPPDQADKLPPALGLLHALARHESNVGDAEQEATSQAIRHAAALYGVSPSSGLAILIAKRLLRKNPVALSQRQAPKVGISTLIILLGLVAGIVVGWIASGVSIHVHFTRFW